ncbi:MAG: 3-dehydroquinate synthase [Planctomycetes bacterium]|nr:3-dehydroquinate synthase [Planctomycetota bacterium]
MTALTVRLGARSYPVVVEAGALAGLGRRVRALGNSRATLVVADGNTARLYGRAAMASLSAAGFHGTLAVLPPGERTKSPGALQYLWSELAEMRAGRDALVVALGGGVVGDLAGFAAATWNRGVDVVQVPTTLLAMVDAAIGGKTGINLPQGKNLVGAFHQPRLVVADLDTLRSLPDREYRAGLAEVVKYGLIGDAALFGALERNVKGILARDAGILGRIVARCAAQKARVVAADEREGGKRMLLNLGHTFGHAVEAGTGYRRYRHGEAVAIGLCAAAVLSERAGVARAGLEARVRALVRACGLPGRAARLDPAALRALAAGDKKARGGAMRYVVCSRVGRAEVRAGLPERAIRAAWEAVVR